jgi:hypothetical protein
MIASPCKTCPKRHLPKDDCILTCEKIQKLQQRYLNMPSPVYSAVDSADSERFQLCVQLSQPLAEL